METLCKIVDFAEVNAVIIFSWRYGIHFRVSGLRSGIAGRSSLYVDNVAGHCHSRDSSRRRRFSERR